MNTKIYVITHKKFNPPKFEEYVPLSVGEALNKNNIYLGDDTGNNISFKNKNFCELTGIYWIWQNDNDSDIVGITHYRRYFTRKFFSRKLKKILRKDDIENILNRYDAILPKKEVYKEKAYAQYCLSSGFIEDLKKVKQIINEKYPDYISSFEKVMNGNHMYQFNMIITKKKIYDEYCNWLFDILFELEKNIEINEKYNDYQKRIFGFISERLLNVWFYKNNLKVKQTRVINLGMKVTELFKLNLRRIKNILIFNFKNKRLEEEI